MTLPFLAAAHPADTPGSTSGILSSTPDAPDAADPAVAEWVQQIAGITRPDSIVWCDGSLRERDVLLKQLVASGTLLQVNPHLRPYSFVARSHPGDVARVEDRTFICTPKKSDAGPTNNWEDPERMRTRLEGLFEGSMRGRTMYVVPFSMGPIGSPLAKLGVQVTDSPYVVVSMGIMTRMGTAALSAIGPGTDWVRAAHTVGSPLEPGQADTPWPCNETKYISHFPDDREIWSFGSAYGGNALLAKKAFALRIASVLAREEGWLAEHMLIVKLTSPEGRAFHLAAAFPSACGKTNLAMLQPTLPGWTVETIGDDIAWMRVDEQGRLRAINPEAGFFGVAPGTSAATNPVAMDTLWGHTIFTNVALREDGDVWWEGMTPTPPAGLTDWQGRPWSPASGTPAAHPNARFTVSARQCPTIADDWEHPDGVVIDAIVFGGRRASNVPLVVEAKSWEHGVFLGATISSERTAAAGGTVGELARDPFAMSPFCGYNMADYFGHWLEIGKKMRARGGVPRIFQVNWFRKDSDGRFIWPGFGDNIRALAWMTERVSGRIGARDTALGLMPLDGDLNLEGTGVGDAEWSELTAVDAERWRDEADGIERFFDGFGSRLPEALSLQLAKLRSGLDATDARELTGAGRGAA